MYPRIGFFRKLPYPHIRILPILIRVSVSVLHSLGVQLGQLGALVVRDFPQPLQVEGRE